ncbi:DUF427 domain-containing protein [Nocardioides dilutus]
MTYAIWNGTVIAQSDDTVVVEGNHYFPPDSIDWDLLSPNSLQTICPWKGVAGYYDITVDGKTNHAAAWHYQSPKPAARDIKEHLAFWGGVRVTNTDPAATGEEVSGGTLRRLFSRGR